MGIDVSVIIPVYNIQDYVSKAVESVLSQTGITFEIILIDDGSTDNSGRICDAYAQKDTRITVIHKQNQGLGFARNSGLQVACGKYVFFLDGDDWILQGALAELFSIAEKHKVDLVCFELYPTGTRESDFCKQPELAVRILDTEHLLEAFFKSEISSTVCSRFYKRKVWNNVKFADVRLHEDAWIDHLILAECSSAYISNQFYYMYYQRDGSLIHKPFSRLNFLCVECGQRYVEFAIEKFPSLVNYAYFQLFERQLYTLDKMQRDGVVGIFKKEYKEIVNDLRKEIPIIRNVDSKEVKALYKHSDVYIHPVMSKFKYWCLSFLKIPVRILRKVFRLMRGTEH